MLSLWRTTVGKKVVMAITGLVLYLFVLVHMVGNLKIYLGAEKYNAYAGFLRDVGSPALPHSAALWLARLVLIAAAVLHVTAAVELWLSSRAARPIGYARKDRVAAGYSAPAMRWGGIALILFVIFHLLHFTWGKVGFGGRPFIEPRLDPATSQPIYDVYRNVVNGFSSWPVSAFYILAMVALGLHLYHGVWSMFQTLGWNDGRNNRVFRVLAIASAVVVVAGNISFPIAVLSGALQ